MRALPCVNIYPALLELTDWLPDSAWVSAFTSQSASPSVRQSLSPLHTLPVTVYLVCVSCICIYIYEFYLHNCSPHLNSIWQPLRALFHFSTFQTVCLASAPVSITLLTSRRRRCICICECECICICICNSCHHNCHSISIAVASFASFVRSQSWLMALAGNSIVNWDLIKLTYVNNAQVEDFCNWNRVEMSREIWFTSPDASADNGNSNGNANAKRERRAEEWEVESRIDGQLHCELTIDFFSIPWLQLAHRSKRVLHCQPLISSRIPDSIIIEARVVCSLVRPTLDVAREINQESLLNVYKLWLGLLSVGIKEVT